MTPKEKAIELANKYYSTMNPDAPDCSISYRQAIECALIVVDEVLSISYFEEEQMTEDDDLYKNYWKLVKTELENLK